MVITQSKLNKYKQTQGNAVDVDDDCNLLGIIESFDFNSAGVESHEHRQNLKETLVCIWDG